LRLVIIQDFAIVKELSSDDRYMGRMSDGLYPGEIRGFNNKATGVAMSEGPIWKHLRKFTLKTLKVLLKNLNCMKLSLIRFMNRILDLERRP
jgi:hypothetical protein